MLAGNRATRVGDQILKLLASLLVERVRDPRVRAVTLTGVDLSKDLRQARVYFSVLNPDEVQGVQAGLDSAKGFMKREVGRRLAVRYVPEIRFVHDPSMAAAEKMEELFKHLNREGNN